MKEIINFCTLFDSNYLDRGLVMYESLKAVMNNFRLYVIAFDQRCGEILLDRKPDNMEVIPYESFEDDTLREAKANRSPKEYIWTCSGYSIRYVLENYHVSQCTYIDADMFFFRTPEGLLEDMAGANADVGIIAHGFGNHPEYRLMEKRTGRYCVQFNTFLNNENGRRVLDWWIRQCLNCCTGMPDGVHFGDQKYLDEFTERFSGIYEQADFGAGVAPWNLDRFVMADRGRIRERRGEESRPLIFVHYHSLEFIGQDRVNINVFIRPGRHDRKLVYSLYVPYVKKLAAARKMLTETYGVSWSSKEGYIAKEDRGALMKDFLTSEPNLWFLIRKIWRFLRYKKYDFIDLSGQEG